LKILKKRRGGFHLKKGVLKLTNSFFGEDKAYAWRDLPTFIYPLKEGVF
jgi:hypothetical protein